MINFIFNKKAIILISEYQKFFQQLIVNKNYIYVFIRHKIILSKKFKFKKINNSYYIICLLFLAINKIYLVKK